MGLWCNWITPATDEEMGRFEKQLDDARNEFKNSTKLPLDEPAGTKAFEEGFARTIGASLAAGVP